MLEDDTAPELDDWALVGTDGHEVTDKIRIREGDHRDLQDKEVLPYKLIRNLGLGGSASVEMVEDVITGSVYARKTFRNVTTRNLEMVKRGYLNEVRIIRRLAKHHHVIRVFATYTAGREFSLILQPVADGGDLAAFLAECRDLNNSNTTRAKLRHRILYRLFGCLADGLSFIHQQTIRHKDIKPQNILIHRDSPIFTDFGLSYDSNLVGHSTTEGRPQGLTKRYCAPEVADWDKRNSKSDIFSLGCVFLEVFIALRGPIEAINDDPYPYYQSLENIHQFFARLPSNNPFSFLGNVVSGMLAHRPEDRPSADLVAYTLQTSSTFQRPLFCDSCRMSFHKRTERFLGLYQIPKDSASLSSPPQHKCDQKQYDELFRRWVEYYPKPYASGDRSFKCPNDCCEMSQIGFTHLGHLEIHQKHHREGRIMPLYWRCIDQRCANLSNIFRSRDDFRQHVDKTHYQDIGLLMRGSEWSETANKEVLPPSVQSIV